MLDMKWIRDHKEEVQKTADGKGIAFSVDELLKRDREQRELLQQTEVLRYDRNRLSVQIGELMKAGDTENSEELRGRVKQINEALARLETQLELLRSEVERLQLLVPNPVSPDTPMGRSDADNVEIKRVGAQPAFSFVLRDHVELGELHGIIDIPGGVKIGGTRSYVLKGAGLLLHRAVQQLALDLLLKKRIHSTGSSAYREGSGTRQHRIFPAWQRSDLCCSGGRQVACRYI